MTTAIETATAYAIDPTHSRIGFIARHAMITKVRGAFNEIEGSGTLVESDPSQSTLQVSIRTASIDTRNADRDGHLQSPDFFDVEQYPTIEFTSTAVEAVEGDRYRVSGDLTIKGVTNPVSFDLETTGTALDPFGNTRLGLEGSTVVNRKDWGLSWNAALDTGGVLVGEKVTLEFEISAVRIDG